MERSPVFQLDQSSHSADSNMVVEASSSPAGAVLKQEAILCVWTDSEMARSETARSVRMTGRGYPPYGVRHERRETLETTVARR